MSDPAPFTFKAAPTKKSNAQDQQASTAVAQPAKPKRTRKLKLSAEAPKKKRKSRLSPDVAVLKACLRNLRKLDPKDALRTVETLRVLFK